MLFLLCCIPLRILIALTPIYVSNAWMPYLGVLLLAISAGFFILYLGNLRLDAPEGGGITWWSGLLGVEPTLDERVTFWIVVT